MALGALETDRTVMFWVILAGSLLSLGYLLPPAVRAFYGGPKGADQPPMTLAGEARWPMVTAITVTAGRRGYNGPITIAAIGLPKGSGEPNREKVGTISRAQLEEIASTKMEDLNANDMDAAVLMITGTAKSMGVVAVG